ncbi:MAG TPA: ATP-dependent RNA helicase [Cellvibrionales bacterium]|jgi:ATP-dependent RNA helicase RhlE|nr:DEAD/DEAH box helicase [Pseudomonadales bacterium]HAB55608.1 ATP-dependent RNA helicase [Cellvibrionales bacterium]HCX26754.1 ATP-dependent RNA helicase [Cellvibrionales bacterium]
MTFSTLGLSAPILKAIAEKGYETPSPIQAEAIPAVLNGSDVMAAAQTGTGKTAGFTLPILQKLIGGPKVRANQARVLVLTPTRELAAQVAESIETYGKHLSLTSMVVFGGVKINPQMIKLRKGVDILVATPGRLLDLHGQNAIRFNQIEVLVLDEADRMLDMGFMPDIRRLLALMPKKRQNLMFSATFSKPIRALARTIVNQPVEISVAPPNATAAKVKQWVCPVDKKRKSAVLTKLIHNNDWGQVLVFTRTKHGANRLTKELEAAHIMATAIHGNKSQGARTRALAEFKQGQVQVLVATDIAARGLDIDQLPHVVNFDLPNVAADYVHRIGRTARAGAEGEAVSLVCVDEFDELADIERLINQILPRETMDGFEPLHVLPVSSLTSRPPRKPKPKKPNKGRKMGGNNQRRDASAAPKKKRPARKPGNRGGSAGAAGAKAGGGARRK